MLPCPQQAHRQLCVCDHTMHVGWRRIVSWHLPGSVHSDSLRVCALQVERLETKVVTPLKFYGPQIKQTRVSEGAALRGVQCPGLAEPEPQEIALFLHLGRDQEMQTYTE